MSRAEQLIEKVLKETFKRHQPRVFSYRHFGKHLGRNPYQPRYAKMIR